jgi:glycosyltransferase involved in cell wall biosynthesis
LVIVDDASTDGTWELLQRWREKAPIERIILLRNDSNIGPTASFLKALDESIGDVVLFSDQDDYWAANKIETLVACFRKDATLLMSYSDGTITNAALEPTGRTIFNTRNKARLELGNNRTAMEVISNPDIKGCTMALKGAFARRIGRDTVPDIARYWGHDHWLALFAYGMGRVEVVLEPLLLHRFHASNASSATRFSLFSMAHWRKWSSKLREQSNDHWYQRYAMVKTHVDKHGYAVNGEWEKALQDWIEIGKERQTIASLPLLKRVQRINALRERGVYGTYYNGAFTLLRDLLT